MCVRSPLPPPRTPRPPPQASNNSGSTSSCSIFRAVRTTPDPPVFPASPPRRAGARQRDRGAQRQPRAGAPDPRARRPAVREPRAGSAHEGGCRAREGASQLGGIRRQATQELERENPRRRDHQGIVPQGLRRQGRLRHRVPPGGVQTLRRRQQRLPRLWRGLRRARRHGLPRGRPRVQGWRTLRRLRRRRRRPSGLRRVRGARREVKELKGSVSQRPAPEVPAGLPNPPRRSRFEGPSRRSPGTARGATPGTGRTR